MFRASVKTPLATRNPGPRGRRKARPRTVRDVRPEGRSRNGHSPKDAKDWGPHPAPGWTPNVSQGQVSASIPDQKPDTQNLEPIQQIPSGNVSGSGSRLR
jgi:hypothetical protein